MGIGWVIAGVVAWGIVCNVFIATLMYLVNKRRFRFPAWTIDVYDWTAVAGIVLVPAVVAVLAMRGRLPGTGERGSKLRGFPIESSQPPGPR